jgi:hypothetical protein
MALLCWRHPIDTDFRSPPGRPGEAPPFKAARSRRDTIWPAVAILTIGQLLGRRQHIIFNVQGGAHAQDPAINLADRHISCKTIMVPLVAGLAWVLEAIQPASTTAGSVDDAPQSLHGCRGTGDKLL